MVQKFKSKIEKHAFDDEKRRESLKKRLREQEDQKNLIKNALLESSRTKSKKIVFDEETVHASESNVNGDIVASQSKSSVKPRLFEGSDNDSEENYKINIKSQFEGKKGQKLLNLQSNYNNDERFKLDERFHEDDDDDEEVSDGSDVLNSETNELENEKAKQFKVLEAVLGHNVQSTPKSGTKQKKNIFEMVRFDDTNEDHKRQEDGKPQPDEKEVRKKKKKKLDKEERKKKRKEEAEKHEKLKQTQTTENKFYQVSNDLKMALRNRKSENGPFSLLKAFSRKLDDEEVAESEVGQNEDIDQDEVEAKLNHTLDDYNKESIETRKVQGIKKEKFFFADDDPRLEEGLKFINMKNSEEAGNVIENYDKMRCEIRERLRLRWQKHRQMKNPFKKKIGGSVMQRSKQRTRGRIVNGRRR